MSFFDPGSLDRDRAGRTAKSNQVAVQELKDWYESNPVNHDLGMTYDPTNTDPNMLHAYQTGPLERAQRENMLDPYEAMAMGISPVSEAVHGQSAWTGLDSAFDQRGPSAFASMDSAFASRDPSAYGDLAYDAGALEGLDASGDYFASLQSGASDPIAEAQLARRTAEAEASRRANVDAALAAEEARGQGSGSGRLLAELSGAQASTSDQYLAGLDAAAMAASRRDNAARQRADVAQMRGQGMLDAASQRAAGLDTYSQQNAAGVDEFGLGQAQGLDTYSNQNAQGQDAFSTSQAQGLDTDAQNRRQQMDDWARAQYDDYYGMQTRNVDRAQGVETRNTGRQQSVGDENVGMWNQAQMYNQGQRQQDFENRLGIQGAYQSANALLSGTYGANAAGTPDWSGRVFEAGANLAGAAATGGASAARPRTNAG